MKNVESQLLKKKVAFGLNAAVLGKCAISVKNFGEIVNILKIIHTKNLYLHHNGWLKL
jgi:hypothetical protein